MSSISGFIDELNKQYNRQTDTKNSLENKSSFLITVCGIVIPLLFGFGIFVIEKIDRSYPLFIYLQLILGLIIIMNILAIVFAVWSTRIKEYEYPFIHCIFFDNSSIKESEVTNFSNSEQKEFNKNLIQQYLHCNKHNFETNQKTAKLLRNGQYVFIASLVLVAFLIGLLFSFPPQLNSPSQ